MIEYRTERELKLEAELKLAKYKLELLELKIEFMHTDLHNGCSGDDFIRQMAGIVGYIEGTRVGDNN